MKHPCLSTRRQVCKHRHFIILHSTVQGTKTWDHAFVNALCRGVAKGQSLSQIKRGLNLEAREGQVNQGDLGNPSLCTCSVEGDTLAKEFKFPKALMDQEQPAQASQTVMPMSIR